MRLYIPSVGDQLKLTADWQFQLYNEHRNSTLMEIVGDDRKVCYGPGSSSWGTAPCVIPAGEILKVDRIYIRKGKGDFDSITFLWKGQKTVARTEKKQGRRLVPRPADKPTLSSTLLSPFLRSTTEYDEEVYEYAVKVYSKPVRFWAKLEDANTIEFELG